VHLALLTLYLWTTSGQGAPLTADAIMAKVAANQDQAEKIRAEYVYKQHIHVVSRKTNKKMMREETADYTAVPTPTGLSKQLITLTGRYWHKGKYLEFKGEPAPDVEGVDGSLVDDFRTELTDDRKSKDGLARDLFPLTTEEQSHYQFKLLGEESLRGRAVYHIQFRPKDKDDSADWAGEAFIDEAEFQPLLVTTKLAHRIPFVVRTMFGTDLPGIGFSVDYQRQPDGIWFPVSFGTEFRVRALFFLSQDVSISLQNSGFEHTHVHSTIQYPASKQ
jgi:hypothetical protein